MASVARRQKYSYVDEWKSLWEPDLEAIRYNGITTDPTKVDPKVLEWAKSNCCHKPHFVKVINPNAAHGRPGLSSRNSTFLYVPTPFVREHFKELRRVVTLENNDDGRTWKVSFGTNPRRDPAWIQGWARVAKDNNLKLGDVVVFVLVGASRFRFTLFDEQGNHRSSDAVEPSCSSHSHRVDEHPKTKKRLFSVPGSPPSPATKAKVQKCFENLVTNQDGSCTSRDASPSNKTTSTKEFEPGAGSGDAAQQIDPFAVSIKSRRRVTTALELQTAEDAAMAHTKSLTAPHFVSVMTETQVYREFQLVLPDSFVAECSIPAIKTQWKVLDCAGSSWEMYSVKSTRGNEITLHRKLWAKFAVHHLLEDGDVCVFELVKKELLAVLVHIFRVVPIANNISVLAHYDMTEHEHSSDDLSPSSFKTLT